jgi:DNA-binding transcriptional regulator GbsR (MarR family)
MPRDEEITFADHVGRFYARRYAFPPMVGRVLGYLLVCEPPEQSIAELSEALLASRSAITGALEVLERLHAIHRSRAAGERMDRVRLDFSSAEARGFDITEYEELGELAREGLEVLRDAPAERKADALEMAAFADFLVEQTRRMQQEWETHRDALRARGELPDRSL